MPENKICSQRETAVNSRVGFVTEFETAVNSRVGFVTEFETAVNSRVEKDFLKN